MAENSINLVGELIDEEARYRPLIVRQGERLSCANRLDGLGFFRFVAPSLSEKLKAKFMANGKIEYGLFDEDTLRVEVANGEQIYRKGIGVFVSDVGPVFENVNVPLVGLVDGSLSDEIYCVEICGISYNLWSQNEPNMIANAWLTATDRVIRAANHMLERRGVPERMYYDFDRTGSLCALLTSEMFATLVDAGGIDRPPPFTAD